MVKSGKPLRAWLRSKRSHYLAIGVLLLFTTVFATGCLDRIFSLDEELKVRAVLDMVEHAYLGENREVLSRVIADSIVVIEGGQQHTYTQQEFLDAVEQEWAGKDYDIWEVRILKITFASGNRDAAVSASLVTRNRGETLEDSPVQISLKKVVDAWKIVRIEFTQVGAARTHGLPTVP
ncbi:MAG TPA: hypothetical protein GXX55_05110 [Firmicutes bacterium]|nr:hypothetical protein [Bacillota bacterium]